MAAGNSRNTIAVLLILALIFAGVGVGIAINNYQSVNSNAFRVIVQDAPPSSEGGQVGVQVLPPEEGENT